MASRSFKPTLKNGVTLNLGTSTMIKELRRGNEFEAFCWVKELERSGFYKYMWRRLLIFVAEDVGIANPDLPVQVRALFENYMWIKEQSPKTNLDEQTAMAVMLIARSPKTRACDDMIVVWRHIVERWGWQPDIPEYATDFHTAEGRGAMGKREALVHWIEQASKVYPDVGMYDWQLWLLRQAHDEWGYKTREEVEETARQWDAEGKLRYGVAGWWPQSWMLPADIKPNVPREDGSYRTSPLEPGEVRIESVRKRTEMAWPEEEDPQGTLDIGGQ